MMRITNVAGKAARRLMRRKAAVSMRALSILAVVAMLLSGLGVNSQSVVLANDRTGSGPPGLANGKGGNATPGNRVARALGLSGSTGPGNGNGNGSARAGGVLQKGLALIGTDDADHEEVMRKPAALLDDRPVKGAQKNLASVAQDDTGTDEPEESGSVLAGDGKGSPGHQHPPGLQKEHAGEPAQGGDVDDGAVNVADGDRSDAGGGSNHTGPGTGATSDDGSDADEETSDTADPDQASVLLSDGARIADVTERASRVSPGSQITVDEIQTNEGTMYQVKVSGGNPGDVIRALAADSDVSWIHASYAGHFLTPEFDKGSDEAPPGQFAQTAFDELSDVSAPGQFAQTAFDEMELTGTFGELADRFGWASMGSKRPASAQVAALGTIENRPARQLSNRNPDYHVKHFLGQAQTFMMPARRQSASLCRRGIRRPR